MKNKNLKTVAGVESLSLKNMETKNKGITLIVLIITIIVLLILAGVTIATLTGENGILQQVGKAKEETEIASVREVLQLAMTSMNFENEDDLIKRKAKFQDLLDDSIGSNKTTAYINGNGYTVHFTDINKVYTIDEKGTFTEENINVVEKDSTPGVLDGTGLAENPYIIMSIEDLLEWSENYNTYKGSYIKLGKTLDFKSELSYYDCTSNDYNIFLIGENSTTPLIEILTNSKYSGFKPIQEFCGNFDGGTHEIRNIYINSNDEYVGFFSMIVGGPAIIDNFGVNGEIIANSAKGCGGIIGNIDNKLDISNCYNQCNISANITGSYNGVGGIVGVSWGKIGDFVTIKNCYNTGKIRLTNQSYNYNGTGGIVGALVQSDYTLQIYNCYNSGLLDGYWCGGIIGYRHDVGVSKITNSYNIGEINTKFRKGGIYGTNIYSSEVTENDIVDNVYWIDTSADNVSGLGTPIGNCKNITSSDVTSNTLLNFLNSYKNSEQIYPSDWNKWVMGSDGYPVFE